MGSWGGVCEGVRGEMSRGVGTGPGGRGGGGEGGERGEEGGKMRGVGEGG